MSMPIKLAVLGNPIAHSLSPAIHHTFAYFSGLAVHYDKKLVSLDEGAFATFVTNFFAQGGTGLNVTVPFKQDAYKLCTVLSERAHVAQAVNTLSMKDGKLHGDNTDGAGLVYALQTLLQHEQKTLQDSRIAIIGAGGASRGVMLPLLEAGVEHITIANRTVSKAENLVAELTQATTLAHNKLSTSTISELSGQYDIIINATSSSLHGQSLTLHYELNTTYAYDMVYTKDHTDTPFLAHFKQKNVHVTDGFSMLIGQAAVSFGIWTGQEPQLTNPVLLDALKKCLA